MAAFGDRLGDAWRVVGSRTGRMLVWVRMTLRLRAGELFEEVMDSVRSRKEDEED